VLNRLRLHLVVVIRLARDYRLTAHPILVSKVGCGVRAIASLVSSWSVRLRRGTLADAEARDLVACVVLCGAGVDRRGFGKVRPFYNR